MVQNKLATPSERKFEHVNWTRYKDVACVSTKTEIIPFIGLRTSISFQTSNGELNLAKLEDRRLIRETQRSCGRILHRSSMAYSRCQF